ncbi:ImmA/IrrE family metallo-endopeptidase [Modestobacter caceresii]|jgi:hypothetical protein|uniref:ImmA/IrrE family metallo-endopeptidase n=1 Tax=Modestobacter caceresii TaxID=1522368 RepID=UPI0009DE2A37|nr:ImmA/IrrE family metallo-endopeptidase [Modestobacter caceresii]
MSAIKWSYLSGDTSSFAIEMSLLDDGVDDSMVDPDERASWGALRIWMNGRNLCMHEEQGELLTGAHWYLLPVIEWFAENWDAIFHEERLPFGNLTDRASRASLEADRRTFGLDGQPDWDAMERVYEWRRRHSLRAAAEGGLLPDLWLRRRQDALEVSVGLVRDPGTPSHFAFSIDGISTTDVRDASQSLFEMLNAATTRLATLRPESERIRRLRALIESLKDGEVRYAARFAWLSGAEPQDDNFRALWREVESALQGLEASEVAGTVGRATPGQLVLTGAKVALLFGSASPTISAQDVRTLTALSARPSDTVSALPEDWFEDATDSPSLTPGEAGSDLGERAYEAFAKNNHVHDGHVDIKSLLDSWSISHTTIRLSDRLLRGVSVYDALGHAAVVANENYARGNHMTVHRFTLAHELAHLLLDRPHGSTLAVSSGPWAPRSVEQRANAFAAALLMPRELLLAAAERTDGDLTNYRSVQAIAARLQVSIASLADRLYNLGAVSRDDADALRAQAELALRRRA